MTRSPSTGWRAVYRWCHVPMTSQREPQLRERKTGGTNTRAIMSDNNGPRTHRNAKQKIDNVASSLQEVQTSDDLNDVYATVEEAAMELVDLKTRLEDEVKA